MFRKRGAVAPFFLFDILGSDCILSNVKFIINFLIYYVMEKIIERIKNGKWLMKDEQLQLFEMPEKVELLKMYISTGKCLCTEAQLRLFDLPERAELFELYVQENYLSEAAELKMLDMPEKAVFFEMYFQKYILGEAAAQKACKLGLIDV